MEVKERKRAETFVSALFNPPNSLDQLRRRIFLNPPHGVKHIIAGLNDATRRIDSLRSTGKQVTWPRNAFPIRDGEGTGGN
jgi:hypothetical protein